MDERNTNFDFDFTPIGQAIKRARTTKGMTREQLARIVDYDPRHLQEVEKSSVRRRLDAQLNRLDDKDSSFVPIAPLPPSQIPKSESPKVVEALRGFLYVLNYKGDR